MNPDILRATAAAMAYDGDPDFYVLGRHLLDLAKQTDAGLWPDSRTVRRGRGCCSAADYIAAARWHQTGRAA